MKNKIKSEDFYQLALALKPTLVTHGVPVELHYSLISDIMFEFANFVDEKSGSSFHEGLFALLAEHAEELSSDIKRTDWLVAELEVLFGKGKKVETNIHKSYLENREYLKLHMEISLGARDISEIDKNIDADARFAALLKKKNGIRALRFKAARSGAWLEVPLNGTGSGDYNQSVDGICGCIIAVTKQWVKP